jgi:hypothetical protein
VGEGRFLALSPAARSLLETLEAGMSEQRKVGRAPLDIYLNKYVSGVPYLARSRDISPEGIRLARLLEPNVSQRRIGLQFQLPGSDEVIYAEGEMVDPGAKLKEGKDAHGVRFTLLTERHRRLIRAYVERSAN